MAYRDSRARIHPVMEDSFRSEESFTEYESSEDEEDDEEDDEDYDEDYDEDLIYEESGIEWFFECIREGYEQDINKYLDESKKNEQISNTQVLHRAIAENGNNVELFKRLLNRFSKSIDEKNKNGKTPLHIAAKNDKKEIASILIEKNADINNEDSKNFSPLLTAVKYDSLDVFKLLEEKMQDECPEELEKFLSKEVNVGSDNKKQDGSGKEKAILTPLQIAVKYNSDKVAKELIQLDKEWAYMEDKKGRNLVYLATENNKEKVLKLLLEKVPEHLAVDFANGKLKMKKEYEENDSDSNSEKGEYEEKDCDSISEQGEYDEKDIDSNSEKGEYDEKDIDSNSEKGEYEENDSDSNSKKMVPLHVAAEKGYLQCLEHLIHHKADVNKTCKEKKTALHLAVKEGHTSVVEKLIEQAPKLKYLKDDNGRTALHDAISHVKIVEILTQSGAKVNKKDIHGRTPISYAAEKGKLECVKKLIEKGADINLEGKNMMSPIHYAAKEGHSEVFRALATNKHIKLVLSPWNCLDLAIDNDHEETAFTIFQIDKKNWKDMLRSRSKCDDSQEYFNTPMRKLIRKMPNIAKEVLNHCTEIRNDKSKPFEVTYFYEFLNDTYHLSKWKKHDDQAATKEDGICGQSDTIKKSTDAYTKHKNYIKENHPLMIMVKYNRTELLVHPLVSALLKRKWNNIGQKLTILNFLLYAVFLALLTGFAIEIRPPFQFENLSSSYTDLTEESIPGFSFYAQYIIIFLASIELIIEIIELKQMFSCNLWIYIKKIENCLEWIICSTAIMFVMNTSGYNYSGFRPPWQWNLGMVSVFLAWINMLFIIKKVEWFGIYVVMLFRILKLFMKFFFVFSLLIVAFATLFHCLFRNQEQFSTFWISLMRTTSMMIGGPDFVATFLDETVYYEQVSYVFFSLFMLLMAIVVINLLVALAVDNIQEFQKDADITKKKMQVTFALELERMASSRIIFGYFYDTYLRKPENEDKFNTKEQKEFAESCIVTENHMPKAMRGDKDNSSKAITRLETKLKILETNIEEHMKFMEDKVKSVLDKFESNVKETSKD